MSGTTPDGGLQPERTSLAWTRAALAFVVLGLATPKLAWTALGGWSMLPAGVVVAGGGALLALGRSRHRLLTGQRTRPLQDGRLPAFAAVLALTVGALALVLLADAVLR